MADVFFIAPANPVRFLEETETDLFLINQDGKCYLQKWQTDDVTKIQIISDFPNIELTIHDLQTHALIATVNVAQMPVNIINQTFLCYEALLDFGTYGIGSFYAKIVYMGPLSGDVTLYSEPFSVQVSQSGTLLYKYKNSENDFSVIFDTNIEFNIRVEGVIEDFTPASDDIIYNDQEKNVTLLNSVPYRSWKLYVGNQPGIANWMLDKVNRALACDQKNIDGVDYEKVEGSKWEIIREIEYPFQGMSIEIMPVENVFLQRIKTGDQPPAGFTIVEKVKNYFGNGADIEVTGIFSKYSLLKHISVMNYGIPFTMSVGTTNGGTEIGQWIVPTGSGGGIDLTATIMKLFNTNTTIYITGLTGTNSDILIDYLQYDAVPAQPLPAPAPTLGRGACIRFVELTTGEFAAAFDVATGQGKVGGGWEGWVMKDGRNGTEDEGGRVPVMYIEGDPIFGIFDNTGGAATHTLIQDELPSFDIPFNYDGVTRAAGSQETMRNFPGANRSGDLPFPGGDQPHNNMQPYMVAMWVVKLAA